MALCKGCRDCFVRGGGAAVGGEFVGVEGEGEDEGEVEQVGGCAVV